MNTVIRLKYSVASLLVMLLFSGSVLADKPKAKAKPKRAPKAAFKKVQDDPNLPRVLLIGDSISIGYTVATQKELKGKANVHRIATNGGPTIRGLQQIDKWLGDGNWDVIHFNWGLHDLKYIKGKHQVPIDQYEKNLTALVARLKKTGAKLIWCSTTPVPSGVSPARLEEDVLAFNQVAQRIMQKNSIATDDLYTFAKQRLDEIQIPKNVHFTPAGSKVLAAAVAKEILSALSP